MPKLRVLDVAKSFIHDCYRSLDRLVLVNLLWFLFLVPLMLDLLLIGAVPVWTLGVALSISLLLMPGATAGVFYYTSSIISGSYVVYADVWLGFRRFYLRSVCLSLLYIIPLAATVAGGSLLPLAGEPIGNVLQAAGILGLLFGFLLFPYLLPALVTFDESIPRTLRRSLSIALDHIVESLILSLLSLMILIALLATVAGIVLVAASATGVFQNHCLRAARAASARLGGPQEDRHGCP